LVKVLVEGVVEIAEEFPGYLIMAEMVEAEKKNEARLSGNL
jgi:hypothetical protein